jgi:hypothetical protein
MFLIKDFVHREDLRRELDEVEEYMHVHSGQLVARIVDQMHEPNFMLVYEVHLGLQIVAFSIIY